MTTAEIWMISLTAVIAVGGIIGACIFYKQLSVMQGQLDVTKAEQRPFVHMDVLSVYVVGNEIQIMPRWNNSGNTPAMNKRNYVNWKIFTSEPPDSYGWPDLDTNGKPLTGPVKGLENFLAPKATQYADILKIPVSVMEDVRGGKLRLFVWGWVEYDELTSNGSHHRTEFCNEVVVTDLGKDKYGKVTIGANFSIYGPHNAAN